MVTPPLMKGGVSLESLAVGQRFQELHCGR